jgi:hypothetical protein
MRWDDGGMRETPLVPSATELPPVVLRSPLGSLEATFVPADAMLGTSLRHRGTELLGPGGIRLHAPWGDSRPWKMSAQTNWALGAELELPHRLALRVDLGAHTLTIRTTLTAGPDEAVPISFGFQPQLALPTVPRAMWRVELPAMEHLELDDRGIPTGASEFADSDCFLLGARTFDDAYAGLRRGARFALSGCGHRITVRFDSGYPCAQVFAPETADVVSFEPMTGPVPPGASHSATFSISVN